jgi:acetyltransferase-like isoleucine patch superfamily enzyme
MAVSVGAMLLIGSGVSDASGAFVASGVSVASGVFVASGVDVVSGPLDNSIVMKEACRPFGPVTPRISATRLI